MTHAISSGFPMATHGKNGRIKRLRRALTTPLVMAAMLSPLPAMTPVTVAHAQNLFAPALQVNDRVITTYEMSQRIAYLTLLRAPGDRAELAREQLLTEALQREAAARAGVALSDAELTEGMEEFVKRFNMPLEKFELAIAQGGVAMETFRDFVSAGLVWRKFARERFRREVRITEEDIDRRLAQTGPEAGVRVLLSEIILPANTPQSQEASGARALQLAEIDTLPAFAAAARRYSAAPSKGRSGRLDWMDLSNLPPALAAQILPLAPGEVTAPLPIQNGIALFQMRAIEEIEAPAPKDVLIDYAAYLIPGAGTPEALASAAEIRTRVDSCNDLYKVAQGQPEEQLVRDTKLVSELPADYAIELAKLDEGESSFALTTPSGQNQIFLMLCSRTRELPEELSRDDIRTQLQNQRLGALATGYLEELRAEAYIEDLAQK
ncbi:Chaperone SurA [Aliiroseovarius sp. xm-m-379]|uniref:peptidylprolyl isomerase n=2 Tax=Aliiroseovarius TaxID=1658781 RepID=UPI0019D85C13|nr:peptidylprolyl isomerase [Aliiroseovarius sp. xm-v-225]NRP11735.1 Chaperone SurA [Aliiroseovarius sp. xm-d-517]NRP25652.1 Chaperone SurA [Aliiroseovarius sp. xm-m-379]NRP31158.1 Chaperone SurA [Aliiroseovarius sp. xm-m-314]NRP34451.1 Chaperone SurA [Aliiroseovarius sp. xm-a-104]NRP41886.1 Chaperone SurA [Aliiroseovarius sp. xm-m-339-2]NRP45182.1 Chaperone SurA [Aliiroseovarius sp. xm-m-378]NRP50914.1 Chaperone SurA [Aliiroseovarius sp. xm-m-354]NRP62892.1 Chaperone SurA [Aliiroseovarius 